MTDQNFMGPSVVLTSITWNLAPLIKSVALAVMAVLPLLPPSRS